MAINNSGLPSSTQSRTINTVDDTGKPTQTNFEQVAGAWLQLGENGDRTAVTDPTVLSQLSGSSPSYAPAVQPLTSPLVGADIKAVTPPNIPAPTAPATTAAYTGGVQKDLETSKAALDASIKSERERIQRERQQLEKEISTMDGNIENTLGDAAKISAPFREQLEASERARLKVDENYFGNQKLISEMESLVNELSTTIGAATAVPAANSIQQGKVATAKEEVMGRLTLLQAVFATRESQIARAGDLIDRSVSAITADRTDQLAYYSTLLNYFSGRKDSADAKLVTLSGDDKAFVTKQISMLESSIADTKETVKKVKEMMVDPATADLMAQAGVKLTDSIDEINAKIAKQVVRAENTALDRSMADKGFEHLPFPQQYSNKPESELMRIKDSRGIERVYWKKPEPGTASGGGSSYGPAARAFIEKAQGEVPTFEQFIKSKEKEMGASIVNKEEYRAEYDKQYGTQATAASTGSQVMQAVRNLRFSSVEESKRIIANVEKQIANGNVAGAEDELRDFGYQKLTNTQRTDYDLYDGAISAFESAASQLANVEAGPYKALAETAKPWLKMQRDKAYVDLRSTIELGQAQLRKGFYGTAVTGSEAANAKNFLITDSDDIQTIAWKMESASNFLQFVNDATIARTVNLPKPDIKQYLIPKPISTAGKTQSFQSSKGNTYTLPF